MPLLSLSLMAQRHTPLRLMADLGAAVLDTSITLWVAMADSLLLGE
jgi:hypothetical protein